MAGRYAPALLRLCLTWVLLPGAAWADVADSYALQVDGDHVRFTVAVNGLPVGAINGRRLSGAYFFLDALLREGSNEVTVRTALDRPYGTAQLTLTRPAGEGAAGPPLWQVKCGFVLPDGTTPACKPDGVYTTRFDVGHAPPFRLWQAQPAALSVSAITASLAAEQAALTQDAREHDWTGMFLGRDVRRSDLLQAGRGVAAAAADMVKNMRAAAEKGGGSVKAAQAPLAGQLTVTALPHDLYAVTRKDAAPVLRVQVGAGELQDPDDFGDLADRYLDGVYQVLTVVYGNFDGKWQRVR